MTRIYWRCNGGHCFSSVHCPCDGWSSDELLQLNNAAEGLKVKGTNPSIAALRSEGASEAALRRAKVVEFGSDGSAFEAVSPDYYVIHNESVRLRQAGVVFH
jgi:hypothetical protein